MQRLIEKVDLSSCRYILLSLTLTNRAARRAHVLKNSLTNDGVAKFNAWWKSPLCKIYNSFILTTVRWMFMKLETLKKSSHSPVLLPSYQSFSYWLVTNSLQTLKPSKRLFFTERGSETVVRMFFTEPFAELFYGTF